MQVTLSVEVANLGERIKAAVEKSGKPRLSDVLKAESLSYLLFVLPKGLLQSLLTAFVMKAEMAIETLSSASGVNCFASAMLLRGLSRILWASCLHQLVQSCKWD